MTPCSICNLYPSDEKMEEIKAQYNEAFEKMFPKTTKPFSKFDLNKETAHQEIIFHLPPEY